MKKVVRSQFGSVTIDLDKLYTLQEKLLNKYVTEVGILGNKTNRTAVVENKKGDRIAGKKKIELTNAQIGLMHEKGSLSKKIPRRSFLEFPLMYKNKKLLEIKNVLWQALTSGAMDLKQAYKALGLRAEAIIQDAFHSHGFGQWRPNSPLTQKRKRSASPLIDSGQLRRSITSRVK